MICFNKISVMPVLPERIKRLSELSYNMWFSWNPDAQDLFRWIDYKLWDAVAHNPVRFLLNVKQAELVDAAADADYLTAYDYLFAKYDDYMSRQSWYDKQFPGAKDRQVAYFSAEFGVHESHPVYSGGLGVLAGDHCKAASDRGIPFVGVGLLYRHGYFEQQINREGWQVPHYPDLNFDELPLHPVPDENGNDLFVDIEMPDGTARVQIWKMQVGRIPIYLMDTDVEGNREEFCRLTGQLYGGDCDTRIGQEILLGIGGVRALRALGIKPDVYHINEGHAAFSGIERMREMVSAGLSPQTAIEVVRSSTVFTTHTPVPAGHDVFSPEQIDHYFHRIYPQVNLSRDEFIALGWDPGRQGFNMTVLAMRMAAFVNGVSQLHGEVTRRMCNWIFPSVPEEEVPIGAVTNGIHTPTWVAPPLRELLVEHLGPDWDEHIGDTAQWQAVDRIPDKRLWEVHQLLKEDMIERVRERVKHQRRRNGEPLSYIQEVDQYLTPQTLTIGFARRFATYKRATMFLRDRDRLNRMVNDPARPVQFLFAGKAHPRDRQGQEFIKEVHELAHDDRFRGKILFIEGYDMAMARLLLHGCDVWLNTPRRPYEASGTSGMKAALNGVLNFSILDGWWPEAYDGTNGFAIGEAKDYTDWGLQDADDAHSLYATLENQVIPTYYRRDNGLPSDWVQMMKSSIRTIAPIFSTERMVTEYAERYYLPTGARGRIFAANGSEVAERVQAFKRFVHDNWSKVHFVSVSTGDTRGLKAGNQLEFDTVVHLGPIWHGDVQVEVVYGEPSEQGLKNPLAVPLAFADQPAEENYRFTGWMTLPQGTFGYGVRVRPVSPDFAQAFEMSEVTWARF